MKKLLSTAIVLIIALTLVGCATTQRYAVSIDNTQKLKEFGGAKVRVVSLTQSATYNSLCRLSGPIRLPDDLTVSQYIAKAINDEFKAADIYAENESVSLSGDVTQVSFSSIVGLIQGEWNIDLMLKSSNGKRIWVSNTYSFKSGFDALSACNATASAFGNAVQDLVSVLINHPKFGDLISNK